MNVRKVLSDLGKLADDIPGMASARLVAALYHRNELISYGFNQDKTHPFQAKWGKNSDSVFWHSETNAIFNALRIHSEEDLSRMNTTLYIARTKFTVGRANRVWGLSAPCVGCQRCIKHYGINRVYYTLDGEDKDDREYGLWIP